MAETAAVRQNHLLTLRIYESDEVAVYNQTFTDANETVIVALEHTGDVALYVAELLRQRIVATVGQGDGRVVAVGCDIYNRVGRYAEQFRAGGENDTSVHEHYPANLRLITETPNNSPDIMNLCLCGCRGVRS